ncbi:hypothetical protein [Microbacterium marinilacus]|uniref:DUF1616 domain-containing protein n=1 Tax=Microbacterium marinilacus TaxID=415209 RepID=A0ABP7BI90_9MICO|nr:hypothetical protein [Microbacterium marinilacus]MBY0688466.1 hypothetical protein [Microbacterium marinilacus]
MSGSEWGAEIWGAVVLSGVLALGFPFLVWWKLARPELLEERYLYARPGSTTVGCTAIIVVLAVTGAGAALGAVVHPFLWASVALVLSGIAATALYLVLYVRLVRRIRREHASRL